MSGARTPATVAGKPTRRTMSVAVLAGGRSAEHEVSLSSGASIRDALSGSGHRVIWIEIGRDGIWRRDGSPMTVTPGAGLPGIDVVFPALHGPFGEDGTVQGLLESIDVPYVGSGVAASAVCLDKVLFKQLMSSVGVPQVDYVDVSTARFESSAAEVLEEVAGLGLPVFVKPAHLGSSMGIVKVAAAAELAAALEQAFALDRRVIVEAAAAGAEVECGVLELDAPDGGPAALVSRPGEIIFPGDWYDFDAKYRPGGMRLQVPAGISATAAATVGELALRAFAASGCEGLARVDFFVEDERVLLNECNTMPGFTPTSVYGKLLAASGVPYEELVERLCLLACGRHDRGG